MTLPIGTGIGLAKATGDGAPVPVDYLAGTFDALVQAAWPSAATTLATQLAQRLGAADLLHQGFTLYDLNIDISPQLSISASREDTGTVLLTCTTGRSRIAASSTQPTVLGEWADPRVSLGFGLSFTFPVRLPTSATGAVEVQALRSLQVLAPDIDSMSLVTDIAFFFDDVVAFFRGVRFVEQLQQLIAGTDFAALVDGRFLQDAIAPVNQKLKELADAGYWFLDTVVDVLDGTGTVLRGLRLDGAPPGVLSLALVARGYDRSGVVEGTISWPRSLGGTQDPTGAHLVAGVTPYLLPAELTAAALLIEHPPDAPTVPAPALEVPSEHAGSVEVVERSAPEVGLDALTLQGFAPMSVPAGPTVLSRIAAGSVVELRSVLGDVEVARRLVEFARGADDLVVTVQTPKPGEPGMFAPPMAQAGELTALWADDDEQTCRRHYRVSEVPVDADLNLSVSVAAGKRWHGTDFFAQPSGWSGTVRVRPAKKDVVTDRISQAVRERWSARESLGGIEASLNPQPLPPQESVAISDAVRATEGLDLQAARTSLEGISLEGIAVAGASRRRFGKVTEGVEQDAFGGGVADRLATTGLKTSHDVDLTPRVSDLLERTDPSGDGVVTGIDFELVKYVAPVVR